jgi:hypothetical protein
MDTSQHTCTWTWTYTNIRTLGRAVVAVGEHLQIGQRCPVQDQGRFLLLGRARGEQARDGGRLCMYTYMISRVVDHGLSRILTSTRKKAYLVLPIHVHRRRQRRGKARAEEGISIHVHGRRGGRLGGLCGGRGGGGLVVGRGVGVEGLLMFMFEFYYTYGGPITI